MDNFFDLHNDFFTEKHLACVREHYYNRAKRQVTDLACVVWTTEFTVPNALAKIDAASKFCATHNGAHLAIEDLHFASKQNIYEIANYQPLYCGLTWNNSNNLASGALSAGGLTAFGEDCVKVLEDNNIFVDTAHLNERSFMDFANITTQKMLCTHTASYSLNSHPRNLKDYQIKIIADSGGLVGLTLVSDFLCGKHYSTLADYIRHIDYCVCKFGIDHFAIGTDFCGTKHLPQGVYDYKSLTRGLTKNLLALGYKPADINKLFYQNAHEFFNK